MTFTEKYLQPHSVFGKLSFEEYCSKIPVFYFRKEVPEDVIKNFQVVEKLLALSFYEYKFIDEAYAKAIHSFEMAMNIRLKELQPNTRNKTFKPLIAKLTKLKLFDTDIQTLKHIEYMRNYYSHPERHSFAGIIIWNRIEFINRLVNELYEDVNLRVQRESLTKEFTRELQRSKLDKNLVIEIQGKPTILYRLQLLFINNKVTPHTYLFACTPLFDLEISDGGIIKVPFVFKSKLVAPTLSDNELEGESFSAKQKVRFSPIAKHEKLLPTFEKWNSEYSNIKDKFQFESSISSRIPDIYIPEIQEFQKM